MTKKLEELFGLENQPTWSDPQEGDVVLDATEELAIAEVSEETLAQIEKIELSLPTVRGLEASDTEMDDIAADAQEAFKNLMDLGMNVDSRAAAEIFSVASSMLGHAITAKNAKVTKKLKMIELQLKQVKLASELKKQAMASAASGEVVPEGQGTVVNRNDLLRQILDNAKASQAKE